jgi:hypothetical protein
MTEDDGDYSYEEVEEVYEIDEEGNEWLVTEEYEEVEDSQDTPTVVIANLQELESNSRSLISNASTSTSSRLQSYFKEPARGDISTVFGDTSTVQISNTSPSASRGRSIPCGRDVSGGPTKSPSSSRIAKQPSLVSRFKNHVLRPEQGAERPQETGNVPDQESASAVLSKTAETEPQPRSRRKVRRIRKARGDEAVNETGAKMETVYEAVEEDPNQPVAVHSLSILRDETTGREISRAETGKKPPHYQPQGPNEKRYMTKTYRKTRTNPVNRHKEVEETTIAYEKPRSPIFEQTLPAAALRPTPELNPPRKTTSWEKPVWVKNKMEAGSSCFDNLEKPVTTATTTRKNAGALSFTIERS